MRIPDQTFTIVKHIAVLLLVVSLLACDGTDEQSASPTSTGSSTLRQATATAGPSAATTSVRTVMVHLFEWTWPDVARECEEVLGPAGYVAVQVSPPQEHVLAPGRPWWERYQPVSYQLESRSGTRAQFQEMVARCEAAGIDIYVDAILNHMSGTESGTGSGGTQFTHYDYPGLYEYDDFHHCGAPFDDIGNYQDPTEVQTCELVNLADLDTSSELVRDTLATYLNDLIDLGVAGFRLDAAKHMHPDDILAVVERLNGDPYIYQEVIDQGGEPISAQDYFQNGDVTEFKYSVNLGRVFRSGRLAELEQFGEAWGFIPSDKAVVFVDNHDNQRGHGGAGDVLTHKEAELYELAVIYMLGWPYGYPRVMSSYPFTDPDAGPPSYPDGSTDPVYDPGEPADCYTEWVCEHRWDPIRAMVAFHNVTAPNFYVTNWWTNGNDQIAFGRGDLGFAVINRENNPLERTFQTTLPPGTYCDVITGELQGDSCSGASIHVDEQGRAQVSTPGMSAVAIHAAQRH